MTSGSSEAAEWRFPNRATPVGSAAYYAVRFSPTAQRQRNAVLIAWHDTIESIARAPHDPGVARLKLDWWHQELEALVCGTARHPLALALHEAGLDRAAAEGLHAVIDAAERDILNPRPVNADAFVAACRGSLAGLFLAVARLDRQAEAVEPACDAAGAYCAAVERIRRIGEYPARVPATVDPTVLRHLAVPQRTALVEGLLGGMAATADAKRGLLPDLARRLIALSTAMHKKMRRKGYPVADTLIDRAPVAQLWTAWRCT